MMENNVITRSDNPGYIFGSADVPEEFKERQKNAKQKTLHAFLKSGTEGLDNYKLIAYVNYLDYGQFRRIAITELGRRIKEKLGSVCNLLVIDGEQLGVKLELNIDISTERNVSDDS